MANIVVMIAPAIGHVMQTFRFANDLQERGHRVTYVSHEGHLKNLVESNGFNFYYLRLLDDRGLYPSERWLMASQGKNLPHDRALAVAAEAEELCTALLGGKAHRDMIDALTPDLIVFEPTLEGGIVLPVLALGIQSVQVLPVLPPDTDNEGVSASSPHLGSTEESDVFAHGGLTLEHITKIAAHYRLTLSELTVASADIPQMVLCPAAFDFPRLRVPHRHYLDSGFSAGSISEPDENEFPWNRIKADRPLIYCSFGTRVPREAWGLDALKTVIQSLMGSTEFQIIVCVPIGSDISEFSSVPDHITLVNQWLPQISLLKKAAVHITHGGFSSVRESLECEVPMIVVPFDSDCPGNAARVVYHGLGVRVMPVELPHTDLAKIAGDVYRSTSYRECLRSMKTKFDQQRDTMSAADFVESLLARHGELATSGRG